MRSGLKWLLAGLFAAVVGVTSTYADATTMLYLTRDELVTRSPIIARVKVGKGVTAPSADGRTILTTTELSVLAYLKGAGPTTLAVEQMGGTYNGRTLVIPGDAKLTAGEEVVVFLAAGDPSAPLHLSVMSQSVFHVDAAGRVHRDLSDAEFFVRKDGRIVPFAPPVEAVETVDALVADVTRIAGSQKQ